MTKKLTFRILVNKISMGNIVNFLVSSFLYYNIIDNR